MSHQQCRDAGRHVCQEPSGTACIESGCEKPAGTWWTHLWCPDHDQERMDRIGAQLEDIASHFRRSS